jgi:hypothetical protein
MRFNDTPAHREADPHSIGFGCDKWLKQLGSNLIYESRTRVSNADLHHPALGKAGRNHKLAPWLVLHGVDTVTQQIEQNLLNLNLVDLDAQS